MATRTYLSSARSITCRDRVLAAAILQRTATVQLFRQYAARNTGIRETVPTFQADAGGLRIAASTNALHCCHPQSLWL